ncbi:MAG TPA: hypothetical protein VFQ70_04235 [Candidatus Saccharimonadaceae bacterium]|nr:hypothetical protein [Candidatus Saccharimonadaceae bacterium]
MMEKLPKYRESNRYEQIVTKRDIGRRAAGGCLVVKDYILTGEQA